MNSSYGTLNLNDRRVRDEPHEPNRRRPVEETELNGETIPFSMRVGKFLRLDIPLRKAIWAGLVTSILGGGYALKVSDPTRPAAVTQAWKTEQDDALKEQRDHAIKSADGFRRLETLEGQMSEVRNGLRKVSYLQLVQSLDQARQWYWEAQRTSPRDPMRENYLLQRIDTLERELRQ